MAARPPEGVFDERRLARELAVGVRGEVRFSKGSRALYSTDASNYRQLPIGVVIPRDADDVVAAFAVCRDHGAPVLARGAGTSLAGQTCNEAVVLDFSKYMNQIVEIDRERRLARVQPGLILDHLRRETEAGSPPLTFGPDPATHDHCTLGGMIGNNSCGVHSVMSSFYGPGPRTSDNVVSLDVLTYDGLRFEVGPTSDDELAQLSRIGGRRGEIYDGLRALRDRYGELVRARYPDIPRRVSGYNLDELLPERGFNLARALVGSESTCAIVLEATVRLMPSPRARALLVAGYRDVAEAGDQVEAVLAHRPIGCEGFDDVLADDNRKVGLNARGLELLPEGGGWLLVEFGGSSEAEAVEQAQALLDDLRRDGNGPVDAKLFRSREEAEPIWQVRESGLGAAAFVPGEPDHWTGWEDAAVPPERIGDYLRDFRTRCSTATTTAVRPTAISGRAACTRESASTSQAPKASAAGAPSSKRLQTSSSLTAARSRASTATARRGPNCCRACSARSSSRPSVSSRRSGIPPGSSTRARSSTPSGSTRTSASAPATARRGSRPISPTRRTTARSPTRRCAASASASADTPRAERRARASWSPARSSTRRAAARACCSKC